MNKIANFFQTIKPRNLKQKSKEQIIVIDPIRFGGCLEKR